MGLIDIIKQKETTPTPPVDLNKLNQQEIQLALQLLKLSTIKGDQVEIFYNLVVKLQNQFLEETKQ